MTGVSKEEPLPPFAEQMAQQLGGKRGLIESSIPVAVFVLANVLIGLAYPDHTRLVLQWAIGASVAVALGIAGVRLSQGKSVRHAINGLFGIALGAYLAWKSGEARDFYLPGIWYNVGYGLALLVSIVVRHPLVGWFWTVIANGGKDDWRQDPQMIRVFSWLTGLWAATFLGKAVLQYWLYQAHLADALGVARIALGYPVFALLLAATFWAVRRTRKVVPA